MKQIIGILGIGVIVMALFFNTNKMNSSNGDLDLASLIALNTANAEEGGSSCKKKRSGTCGVITGCTSTPTTDTCSTVVA